MNQPSQPKRHGGAALLCVFFVLLLLAAAGRAVSYFSAAAASDIACPKWLASLADYGAELIAALRVAVGLGALTAFAYRGRKIAPPFLLCLAAALLDYAARFVIDSLSGNLGDYGTVAVFWLLGEFLYEAVFTAAGLWVILSMRRRFREADTPRRRAKFAPLIAAALAVLPYAVSRVLAEIWYLVSFLLTYSGVTSTEIASIVGSFLRILAIYGAFGMIASRAAARILLRRDGRA
ncbi:MAG: hypothetical protein K6A33_13530 [Clostridiales bacterium]|nr:hypothetical protein [Clostridiales bacterium]